MPGKRLSMLSDLSEQVPYDIPGLPVYARRDPLSIYPDYRCPSHWHRDLEFVRVITGHMDYFVNGVVTPLEPGCGIVVNSSRLHYGFSAERRECLFSCALVSPDLFERLTAATGERCERAFDQGMDDFLTLSPDVPWQRDVLAAIDRLVDGMRREIGKSAGGETGPAPDPLPVAADAIALCDRVLDRFSPASAGRNGDAGDTGQSASDRRDRMDVLAMTGLIQSRFRDPLALADIAAAGHVSRTRCCVLFRRYVGRTPGECLTERRIEEAKRLLRSTAGSVAEIARACGFSSPSYFISVFRRRTGMTPGAFREPAEMDRDGRRDDGRP